ncbi:MAG: MFS transporter [Dehalococcoidia bacterium]
MQSNTKNLEGNVRKYYIFHLFLNLQLWWPIWVIYLTEERGLSLAQVTLIDIPFWLCIIFLQVPGAALADRFGRKPILFLSAIFFSIAIVFFGLASSFWLLLVSYLIWGVGFSMLWGVESAFLYDSLKALGRESEYPRIYGQGWAIAMAAQVAGTLLGAPLAAATSLQTPIILSGLISAFAAVTALWFVEPLAKRTHHLSYGEIIGDSARLVKHQPDVRYAILFFGVLTIGSVAVVFFFQPFLVDHDVKTAAVGIWQTPMRIAGIIAALVAHRLMTSLGERRTFYLMPALIVVGYVILATWGSIYAQIAFPLINFAVILSQPTVTDYLNRRVPSEQRATTVSLTNLVRSAVLVPIAPLLGLLAVEVSKEAAYWAGGIIVAVLAIPLFALWWPTLGRTPRRESLVDAAAAGD